ncbi:MAG: hypothetical protein IJI22_04945 [Bacilli bacterium]|nr:hypothetical protein [Bacilli bacterium]
MKDFTSKVLEELNALYSGRFDNNFSELIMALFMQIFSYQYDNDTADSIKYKNIDEIMKVVWTNDAPKEINGYLLGMPYIGDQVAKSKFYECDDRGKTEYILNEIRNSIVHGSFNIDSSNNTISIYNDRTDFNMIFNFDCIVDVCNLIFESLYSDSEVAKDLFEFKTFIENISSYDEEYIMSKLEKTEFRNLRYPITLFNMLPMNEEEFHKNYDYALEIAKLFVMRDRYKNGNFKEQNSLSANELYKLRNFIAHGLYFFDRDDFVLHQNKEMYIFSCSEIDYYLEKKYDKKEANVSKKI